MEKYNTNNNKRYINSLTKKAVTKPTQQTTFIHNVKPRYHTGINPNDYSLVKELKIENQERRNFLRV